MKTVKFSAGVIICLLLFAVNSTAEIKLRHDVNGDGFISSADARIAARTAAGIDETPPADSELFADMKLTEYYPEKICMEDARLLLRLACGCDSIGDYYSDSEALGLFNTLTNSLKSGAYPDMTCSRAERTKKTRLTEVFDFGEKTEKYRLTFGTPQSEENLCSPFLTGRALDEKILPVEGCGIVSSLETDDIENITLSLCCPSDPLAGFDDDCGGDISGYKNKNYPLCLKISVTTKADTLSDNGRAEKLWSEGADYIIEKSSSYSEGGLGGFTSVISAAPEELNMYVTAEYCFSCGSFAPVCARYEIFENTLVTTAVTLKNADGSVYAEGIIKERRTENTVAAFIFS